LGVYGKIWFRVSLFSSSPSLSRPLSPFLPPLHDYISLLLLCRIETLKLATFIVNKNPLCFFKNFVWYCTNATTRFVRVLMNATKITLVNLVCLPLRLVCSNKITDSTTCRLQNKKRRKSELIQCFLDP